MTWLAVKATLKKVWHFFKTYWYVPLLISWAAIVWLLFKKDPKNLVSILHSAEKSYRDQIRIINEAHDSEIKKRDETIKKYHDTIEKLEAERKKKNQELTEKEKKRVKELTEKYRDDPESFAREMAEKFGFEFVETK